MIFFKGPKGKIDLENISIKTWNGPAGILLSGGADSSLLLYILMAYTNYPIKIYTLGINKKGRTTAITSSKIIEKCIQLTNNTNIEHIVSYADTDVIYNRPQKDLFFSRGIKVLYSAMTANPPLEVTNNFQDSVNETTYRNPEETRDEIYRKIFYKPFTNINKRKIYEIYKKLDLLESLFPYTHSC